MYLRRPNCIYATNLIDLEKTIIVRTVFYTYIIHGRTIIAFVEYSRWSHSTAATPHHIIDHVHARVAASRPFLSHVTTLFTVEEL